jgi:DNA-binding XRE family transcriptional regulator
MTLREVLAENLKRHRLATGLSQEELAHRADIDRTYVSSLERGRYSASIDKIESLIAPSVSSRRAMVERKRFSAWTSVAIGPEQRRLRLVGAVGAAQALDRGVGLPARLEQIVDAQPLVPCAQDRHGSCARCRRRRRRPGCASRRP